MQNLKSTWRNMISRCHDHKNAAYKNYGARGIRVCDAWRASFSVFANDMGPRPLPGYSLDRVDNNGGYSPENCRWATSKTQVRNSRTAKITEKDVREMVHAVVLDGLAIEDLALAYPISCNQIRSIILGKHFVIDNIEYPKRLPRRADAKQYRGGSTPKIDEKGVRDLRHRFDAGEQVGTLAIAFGISASNAYAIASRRTWRNIK